MIKNIKLSDQITKRAVYAKFKEYFILKQKTDKTKKTLKILCVKKYKMGQLMK